MSLKLTEEGWKFNERENTGTKLQQKTKNPSGEIGEVRT